MCLRIDLALEDLLRARNGEYRHLRTQRLLDTKYFLLDLGLGAGNNTLRFGFGSALGFFDTAAPRFSACEMISPACARARCNSSAARLPANSRSCLPRSAAARPSAICFCLCSMARMSGGQINFIVNQIKIAKATAWESMVIPMFTAVS